MLSISFLVSLWPRRQARPRVKIALNNSFPLLTHPTDFNFFSILASFCFIWVLLASICFLRESISASSWSLHALVAFYKAPRALMISSHLAMESAKLLVWALMVMSQTLKSFFGVKVFLLRILALRLRVLAVLSTSLEVESAMSLRSWTMFERSNW